MITHFLGHKFTTRSGENLKHIDFCLVCIQCGLYVYIGDEDCISPYYIIVEYEKVKLNISCNEFFIKRLLE